MEFSLSCESRCMGIMKMIALIFSFTLVSSEIFIALCLTASGTSPKVLTKSERLATIVPLANLSC